MSTTPDLVLLGNLLVDDIVFPDGRTRMAQAGGAMLYASLAAASYGTRTGCVSLRGVDYPAAALDALRSRGVLLDGVHDLRANGVRTWLLYEGSIRRVIHRAGCPTHEAVSPNPEHVPESWRRARAFHLAPMPIATQRALVHAIRGWEAPEHPAFISLDPHVPISPATLGEWREILAGVDLFLPSDDEMQWPDAATDTARAFSAALAGGRLRYVAWKRGARGGVFFDARAEKLQHWAPGPTNAVDPTGAGDAFAAGFVSAWLEGQPADAALRRAVESADRVIGAWGPEALLESAAPGDGLRGKARAAAKAARAALRRSAPGAA